jgi:hypothetical protein
MWLDLMASQVLTEESGVNLLGVLVTSQQSIQSVTWNDKNKDNDSGGNADNGLAIIVYLFDLFFGCLNGLLSSFGESYTI